jgi:hypothetical protein
MSLNAKVSADRMGVDDRVQVTFSVTNAQEDLTFKLPPELLQNFQLLSGPSQGRSQQVFINGNQTTSSTTVHFTCIVKPKTTGTFTVSGAVFQDAQGHSYITNALTIQVVKGSLAQQQQQDPFGDPFGADPMGGDPFAMMRQLQNSMMQAMRGGGAMPQQQAQVPNDIDLKNINQYLLFKVTMDKHKVYPGQPVMVTYKLCTSLPMQIALSKVTTPDGCWTQDLALDPEARPTVETINGKQYSVWTLKKLAIFPQQHGEVSLVPEIEGKAQVFIPQRNIWGQMVIDPSSATEVPLHIKNSPQNITVVPFPETNKPASFKGAVGKFSIQAALDRNKMTTDDAATYTLTIKGSGNLKLIPAPALELPAGIDVFEPQITDTITDRSTAISGSKILRYGISAHEPGGYDIPALAFSYFDPATNTYQTLHTEPFKIEVTKGKNYDTIAAKPFLADIRPSNNQPYRPGKPWTKPLFYRVGYWSLHGLLLLLFMVFVAVRKRQEALAGNTVLLKNKRANKVALKRLQTAKILLEKNQHDAFYEEISKAIWLYLSDKLNIPLSKLSKEQAEAAMNQRKVPTTQQQTVQQIVQECETALYMPAGGNAQQMAQIYRQAVLAIGDLEGIFKS